MLPKAFRNVFWCAAAQKQMISSAFASRSAFCFCLRRKDVFLVYFYLTLSTAIGLSQKWATGKDQFFHAYTCQAWQTFEKPVAK